MKEFLFFTLFICGVFVGLVIEAIIDTKAFQDNAREIKELRERNSELNERVQGLIKEDHRTINILDRRDAENGDLFNPF